MYDGLVWLHPREGVSRQDVDEPLSEVGNGGVSEYMFDEMSAPVFDHG